MTDVVLNTNVFRALLDDEIIEGIVRNGDHVFVAECAWNRELKGVYGPKHMTNTIYSSIRKIENHFHVKKLQACHLPQPLERAVVENDGDDCDLKIACLAYIRYQKSKQIVQLVSRDHCFQNPRILFDKYGVRVMTIDDLRIQLKISVVDTPCSSASLSTQ